MGFHVSSTALREWSAAPTSGGLRDVHVPADVASWATVGLVALGLIGLLVPPGGSLRFLRRAAGAVFVATPFATAILAAALVQACPLYETYQGYCSYSGQDVLGGWVSEVVFFFVVDAAFLAVLLLVSTLLRDDRLWVIERRKPKV